LEEVVEKEAVSPLRKIKGSVVPGILSEIQLLALLQFPLRPLPLHVPLAAFAVPTDDKVAPSRNAIQMPPFVWFEKAFLTL
jgi:hypothetical protein